MKSETAIATAQFGPLTTATNWVFTKSKQLSLMYWLGLRFSLFRSRAELTPEEVASPEFTRRRAIAIDFYVVGWLVAEAFLVCLVIATDLGLMSKLIVGGLLLSRIIEIVQVTVNASVFDSISGRPDNLVASRTRMMVMAFINFAELFVCFGTIYAADPSFLSDCGKPAQAATGYYFSVITQLTIGYGDVSPTGYLRAVASIQGIVGLIFAALVFGRFVAALPQIRSILEDLPRKTHRHSAKTTRNAQMTASAFHTCMKEIVRRVAGLLALADQLEQRPAQARKQVDKLTPSLLARAFAGQLVPQNPTDEPAEKLLARIRTGGKS